MSEKRYWGIDLHRRRFTCCLRLENGRTYLSEWKLERLQQFVNKLRPSDEVAVEVTGNTRLFYEVVAPQVARVVVVEPNRLGRAKRRTAEDPLPFRPLPTLRRPPA